MFQPRKISCNVFQVSRILCHLAAISYVLSQSCSPRSRWLCHFLVNRSQHKFRENKTKNNNEQSSHKTMTTAT
uniref:Secreted protein n=1 Tax=Anguilla anguilla TaxID=7936 RepID=A0A0E9W753_ANGAN